MKKWKTIFVAVLAVGVVVPAASAGITFFVNPNAHPLLSSTLDVPWQTAVGNNFIEFDLDGFANNADVDKLFAGPLTIDVGLGGLGGAAGTAEIFKGAYGGGGGAYGTVFGGAFLNRDASNVIHSEITFDFSSPVQGAGMWVFDNAASSKESFELIATDADGTVTSSVLESGNGLPHFVEGWLGATSDKGLTSLSIRVVNEVSQAPVAVAFEIDHFQIVPAPGALVLGALGLGLVGWVKKRRRT